MEELGTRALTDLGGTVREMNWRIPPYLVDLFNRYMFGIFKEWFMTLLCLIVYDV